jgi:protocatechuate 3,4-dioxygenase beta subunit
MSAVMTLRLRNRLLVIIGLAVLSGAAGLSAHAQAQGTPPPSTAAGSQTSDSKTGLVMGQVVDADTGQPIAGAIVRLAMRNAAAAQAARSGTPGPPVPPLQLVELTDNEGRFLFHDLSKGNVSLNATAPGYMVPAGPGGRGGAPNRPVAVGDGERVFDQKIRLVRFATISGTVVDEAGDPAVGFIVEASKRKTPGVASGPTFQDSFSTVTDDRGMYRISQIPPGDYFVVSPQTQMTMPAQVGDDLVSGLMSGGMGGLMGDLMASGGAAIGALGGVRVGNLMWSSGASASGSGFSGPAMLGGPGGRLPGPPPPASGRLLAYQTTFYPAALTTALATVVTLRSGENRDGIDFQLRPVVTSRVSGTVTGPTGPMKNIAVRLVPAGSDSGADTTFDVATAMTGGDGAFTMLGVPAGQYVAKVEKAATPDFREMMAQSPEMAAAIPPGLAAFMPQGSKESLSAEAPIGVGDTDTTGVTLVMAAGKHFLGHLEFEGTAAKPTAQQMKSLQVTALPVSGGMSFGSMSMDFVNPTGEFKTAGFPPGQYYISVSPGPGLAAWMPKSITVGGRDVTNDAIELKGSDISDIVLSFTDQISNISGNVRKPATGGFEGVSIVCVPAEYQKWFASGGVSRRNPIVAPGADGAFTIGRVPPGDYLIIAVDNGVLEATQTVDFYDRLARMATRITVNLGEKKTVTLDVTKVIR